MVQSIVKKYESKQSPNVEVNLILFSILQNVLLQYIS